VEFYFTFADRFETRERHAQAFAAKLRRMGYPEASAKPCREETACWLVIAPKSVRIDLKKLIPLSKELDQLASDEYGRYSGWECEPFRQDDERILSTSAGQATSTTGALLTALEQTFILQCACNQ
jgi:hypothetical protein